MYVINVLIFNEIHLRLKKERVSLRVLLLYYTFYKIALTVINVISCYWSLYKYARYFARRHPKVTEDEQAVQVVLSLEREDEEPVDALPEITEGKVANTTVPKRYSSHRMSLALTKAGNRYSVSYPLDTRAMSFSSATPSSATNESDWHLKSTVKGE